MSDKNVEICQHGIICSMPSERFGYFGWPSIARQSDGTIVVAASGLRFAHVCPWGKSVLFRSHDEGLTWSNAEVVNNTALDDRDTGIVSLAQNRLALTWFSSDTDKYRDSLKKSLNSQDMQIIERILDAWTDATREGYNGSWIRVSEDGHYWGEPRPAPVNAPHGFIVLVDGSWLYLGKAWQLQPGGRMPSSEQPIQAARSQDEGRTWSLLGAVPLPPDMHYEDCHEPHAVQLPDGSLLGFIRHHKPFQILLSRSLDGGTSWTEAKACGVLGSPPHAILHSSGAIICVYGYRLEPYGQRVMISHDYGKSWQKDIVLRDDGPDHDLGYPASVELANGDILTIYYQKLQKEHKNCALLYTRWRLTES